MFRNCATASPVQVAHTGYSDPGAAGSYYKLSAVDAHGNESSFALLTPSATTGVPHEAISGEIALSAPRPNPALNDVELRFAMPTEGRASVMIYDAGGRRKRTLVEGTQPAGERALTWNLRDDGGHRVPPGLYFVRLETQGRVLVRKLAAIN